MDLAAAYAAGAGSADRQHEINNDGYRMHARIDGDQVKLLSRTGLIGTTATTGRSRRSGPLR